MTCALCSAEQKTTLTFSCMVSTHTGKTDCEHVICIQPGREPCLKFEWRDCGQSGIFRYLRLICSDDTFSPGDSPSVKMSKSSCHVIWSLALNSADLGG